MPADRTRSGQAAPEARCTSTNACRGVLWMGSAGEYGHRRTPVSAGEFFPNRFEALGRLDPQHSARGVDPEVPSAEAVAQRIVRRGGRTAADGDRLETYGGDRQAQFVGTARLDDL